MLGNGERQVRVEPNYGNVFDHFAVEFEYDDGFLMSSQCRQTDGCDSRVEERIIGSEGSLLTRPGYARITGKHPWVFDGENGNPYVQEHVDLIAAITSGTLIQEARAVAESTLTAIMGRLSAYTGKLVTWDQALASKLQITPAVFEMGPLPVAPVPVPGRTPLG